MTLGGLKNQLILLRIARGTSADRVHLLTNAFQKNETVRYAGRNMHAGRMQKTPTIFLYIFCPNWTI